MWQASTPPSPDPTPVCTPSLREALNYSISSGKFVDTKIILFSRRDSSGNISKPKALYANSRVLRTVPYFNGLLFGQFGEAESKDFSEPLDNNESADDYGYHSDSDLEEDGDFTSQKEAAKHNSVAGGYPSDPFCFPPAKSEPVPTYGEYEECLQKGKVIKIQDVAFITFQAFLLYLYTNSIDFAPYGSESNRGSRSAEIISESGDSIPRPSPKSVYRLADKYDVPSLKKLALESIRDGLVRCDIVEEIFSRYTSRYDEVRTMQINHLASARFGGEKGVTKNLCDKIDEKVDAYVAGGLKHATETMSLLWEASKKGRSTIPPPQDFGGFGSPATTTAIPTTTAVIPATPQCLKPAFIRSIREGVFADRKYFARHSKARKALRPVYFSSIVIDKKLTNIDKIVQQHEGDEYFEKGDRFEDSDYEGGIDQSEHPATETVTDAGGESERDTFPILTIGSFASWASLFFYLCTESIRFAPLKSQGLDARAKYIQEEVERDPHAPPPCSPKAIHSLATALNVRPLADLALKEIRSKITSANVVDEFFSSPTSRRIEVMELQYKLLSDTFNNQDTNASTADLIKSMADGTRTHHASALKFGLREGFSRIKLVPAELPPEKPSFGTTSFGAPAFSTGGTSTKHRGRR